MAYTALVGTDDINMARLNSVFAELDASISGGSVTGTAGENLSERDFVYLGTDGEWYQLDTDATATVESSSLIGCVAESGGISNNNTGTIKLAGIVSGFSGLTAWDAVYAATTAGSYTQTRPNVSDGGGQIAIIELGFAISTTEILLNVQPIIYAKRETLADDATLTIEHHEDDQTRGRRVFAYVATSTAGSTHTDYADSNQDEDVSLRDQTAAGYGSDFCTGGTASSSAGVAADAFDDDNGTFTNLGSPSCWLKYDLGSGNSATAERYTIEATTNNSRTPSDWTFEGSNNDSDWDTLDSQSGITSWGVSEKKTFDFTNSTAYRYYRLSITADNGANSSIAEFEAMESLSGTDGPDKLAQSFQVTGSQTVDEVKLWLKKVGSPTGTMTLRIETDSSGDPSGVLAHANLTVTVAESGLGASYADVSFSFASSASISGSTTYWIVLSTDRSASQTDYVDWGADGSSPGYANGEMKSESSSSWSAESKDAVFSVEGPGTVYDEPLAIGSVTGDSEEMGVRYDDGAGSDGDTKTTFKNLTGASADIVCGVVL